jgi:hypothetical protein
MSVKNEDRSILDHPYMDWLSSPDLSNVGLSDKRWADINMETDKIGERIERAKSREAERVDSEAGKEQDRIIIHTEILHHPYMDWLSSRDLSNVGMIEKRWAEIFSDIDKIRERIDRAKSKEAETVERENEQDRIKRARWEYHRKIERIPLLRFLRFKAAELGVHPVFPYFRDELQTVDPLPPTDLVYPCHVSQRPVRHRHFNFEEFDI